VRNQITAKQSASYHRVDVVKTAVEGALIIEPKVFRDARGFFLETYSRKRYEEANIPGQFVQDNLSFSRRGVLRGLHFQNPNTQGKLVSVPIGEVFDVAVDIRLGSPTFGKWAGVHLSGENKRQFWVPPGLAHGFVVLSETALFSYKCTEYYSPKDEHAILWNDPEIGIEWPLDIKTELSGKDSAAKAFHQIDRSLLPEYKS
jgi:dTDP-4-dehydrorhamnose 3,5-epimerase